MIDSLSPFKGVKWMGIALMQVQQGHGIFHAHNSSPFVLLYTMLLSHSTFSPCTLPYICIPQIKIKSPSLMLQLQRTPPPHARLRATRGQALQGTLNPGL